MHWPEQQINRQSLLELSVLPPGTTEWTGLGIFPLVSQTGSETYLPLSQSRLHTGRPLEKLILENATLIVRNT